mmetsp:Transcript_17689/g.53462  ORF Transcript_17689/g.53462 Transcript_17689/m.53462 type:complete len:102 (-) Transcript_17689:534-839(-)
MGCQISNVGGSLEDRAAFPFSLSMSSLVTRDPDRRHGCLRSCSLPPRKWLCHFSSSDATLAMVFQQFDLKGIALMAQICWKNYSASASRLPVGSAAEQPST